MFGITAINVFTMIAYGIPGYLLIKTRHLGEDSIKTFAKMLLYVCQPALSISSFDAVDFTPALLADMGIFFGITLAAQLLIIFLYRAIFYKKVKESSAHKVCSVAGACGNVGFLGIPLLEKLLPENPEVVLYSVAFSISMNLLAWTVGLMMMTGDRKYIRLKNVFFNPSMIAFAVGFLLFVFKIKLPSPLSGYVSTLGRMSTVVCMTVMGMRLGTKRFSELFTNGKVYIAAASKLLVFPVIVGAMFLLVPVSQAVRSTGFILGCCPAAAMIQSLAETYGGDSETAANVVLTTCILCILTIPLMWTLYSYIIL